MPDGEVPGSLGHFEVAREIGRGGMGVVYLARDTKLDREVAIKALPEGLAGDHERLARFEQEARTLASLNHPNIASIYGLEEVEYLDNQRRSDVLVLFAHAVGRDHEQWREHLRSLPYRAIAPTQVAMRLIAEAGDDLLPIDGLLSLEPNLALETCQVTRHLCEFEPGNEAKLLEMLNEFSRVPESLDDWIILYDYVLGMISKCRDNIEGLRDFAREVVEPFRGSGESPFIGWYRATSERVRCLRCVFSETPVYNRRILEIQLQNLDTGCLGGRYREDSIRIERGTTHLDLYHVERVSRYLREMVQELSA